MNKIATVVIVIAKGNVIVKESENVAEVAVGNAANVIGEIEVVTGTEIEIGIGKEIEIADEANGTVAIGLYNKYLYSNDNNLIYCLLYTSPSPRDS